MARKRKAAADSESSQKVAKTEELESPSSSTEPTASDTSSRTIYCGGIPYVETEKNIKKWFEESCGPVENIEMLKFPETEDFRGIALVCFQTDEAVEEALGYHHCEWNGNYIVVKRYDSSKRKGQKEADKWVDTAKTVSVPTEGPFVAYIGNLDWEVDEDGLWTWLMEHLSRRTKIVSARITESNDRKFGFAEFPTGDALVKAVEALNGQDFWGREAKVMIAASNADKRAAKGGNKPQGDGCSLIVRCMPQGSATVDTIRRLFAGHKPVDVYVPRNSETFGFVRFASSEEATAAVNATNGALVDGTAIKVKIAEKGRN